MAEIDNTSIVLYHYLRALSVKVSRSTVSRLLDTPMGNSMRGISDALDALHIKNEVYQLPPSPDYFLQLDAPFITMLQVSKNPFCVVTKRDDFIVEYNNSEGEKRCIKIDTFLKKWTGTVLFGETTEGTPSDSFYIWRNICYCLLKYKVIITIFLVVALSLSSVWQQDASPTFIAYLGILAVGILVSVAILYKEQINERFFERFCHIGKAVDCNKVLHSKGASIAGASLGELSLLYFTTLFFFCTIRPTDSYSIAFVCSAVALCFTFYSVIYQIFILRKGCMLCMLINIAVWISVAILYKADYHSVFYITLPALSTLLILGFICLIVGASLKTLYKDHKEKFVLQNRMASLLKPEVFQHLLLLEECIESTIAADMALQNQEGKDNRLMIVTNPNCRNCAKIHQQIEKLSLNIPISIVLLTFPNDKTGERIAQTIITVYLAEGWQRAIQLLGEWYTNKQNSQIGNYTITPEAERIWKEQQEYCRKQGIDKTPVAITAGYYVPEVYTLQELRYVLT